MVGSALVPIAVSQARLSEKRILLVAVVFSARARFRSATFKSSNRPRKALLIGISYRDSEEHKLVGPHKDVRTLKTALIDKFGFRESEIVLLLDRNRDDAFYPSRENMIRELNRFVSSKDKNTDYVFAYAGHCFQFPVPRTQEEPDGLAEALVPADAMVASGKATEDTVIFDFNLKRWLVGQLGPNSRLIAIIDACNSATVLNLEHHRCNRTGGITAKARSIGRRCISGSFGISMISKSLFRNTVKAGASVGEVSFDTCTGFCTTGEREQPRVVCISASKDSEGIFEDSDGRSLIQSILRLWNTNPNPTYKQLSKATRNDAKVMRHKLRKDYRHFLVGGQTGALSWADIIRNNPLSRWIESCNYVGRWNTQISTLYPLDLNKPFILCGSAAQ